MDIILSVSSWASRVHDALREDGHRSSGARRAIVELIAARDCCVTAPDLFEASRKTGRPVGLASVYRVLDLLTEKGFVQKLDLGDDHSYYEQVEDDGEHHHHLVCNDCGRVEAFADEQLETALRGLERQTGFSVESHDVLLRGSCEACKAA